MSPHQKPYVSEDESAGYASPIMDIVAAVALTCLSIWVMVESLALKRPDSIATAPGLLPFIVALSLGAMALTLGILALHRHRTSSGTSSIAENMPEDMLRTALLIAVLVSYVAALEVISFSVDVNLLGLPLKIGAFEVISVIVLSAIFRIFWTNQIWQCVLVAAAWIAFLSIMFQAVFAIPLPGSV